VCEIHPELKLSLAFNFNLECFVEFE